MAAISSRPFLVRSSVLLTRCGYGAVPSGPPLIAPDPDLDLTLRQELTFAETPTPLNILLEA